MASGGGARLVMRGVSKAFGATRALRDVSLEVRGGEVLALVGRLSTAARQLVEIARSLAGDCRVLILDEPTSSLTQQDIKTLFELIARLKAQGLAIVYISHFLEEVR